MDFIGIALFDLGLFFYFDKKSLEHFNPYQVGALRVLISGVLLSPIALLNIKKFPKSHLKWLIIAALCGNFIPMFLFPYCGNQSQQQYCRNYQFYDAAFCDYRRCSILEN